MVETFYDKINDYGSVTIKLASPDDIRSWSFGEVKKPETINYRTYRAEKDGLFCERIFGPERDWECYCGKYKGIKYKGIVCDRCGVKVAHSKVRRKRMGHINLASPVAHIWFFKAMPSRLSTLLGIKNAHLERVIYFQDYIVIDPGDTKLKKYELLSEERLKDEQAKYGDTFEAGMGAEAIQKLLHSLDLDQVVEELHKDYENTGAKQRQKEIIKRLELVKMIKESGNKAEWMILEVIPVIPPDLRPLVLLDSGNFATSDLNDLYRRLINRNNRLKKLLEMNAPDVIIRNEKRMLQQSVDALFDNSRCRRPVLGTGNRAMKSLTDMIKGKQGRFRENLLGKRVDYSARSVIVVGPDLKLHQCGLPKKIALELFQPFIIRKLKELGHADTIKSAKKMLERKDKEVWDILEDVIREHPVLLNRAPTLHRVGIQAFEPILTEGNAIKIHPLVCAGFNADFDGDQMAVHLPLSIEAQVEATTLMLSTNNIFSPANGEPIIAPSQDIVLGVYYYTIALKDKGKQKISLMSSFEEVFLSYEHKKLKIHEYVWIKLPEDQEIVPPPPEDAIRGNNIIKTTVGRIFFNHILPKGMPFYNKTLNKKAITSVISECHNLLGHGATLKLLDDLKELGFNAATKGGITFAKNYLIIPPEKQEIIQYAHEKVAQIEKNFKEGAITGKEKHNSVVDCWTHARDQVGQVMMKSLELHTGDEDIAFNPLYLMASSGARGSLEQIRQLAGMRGLMAKPSGAIIETPIIANFREGLKVLEYFSSTHGARKGLADTALKTADSGYLTRKLADVAQNVVINEIDCGTPDGTSKGAVKQSDKIIVPLSRNIRGRYARNTITNKQTGQVIVKENELITNEIANKIEALGYEKIRIRSPLTCQTPLGVCAMCYGMDLARGKRAEEGLAVGIIAAQSIGEPGTQLTMRTFHIGGVAVKMRQETEITVPMRGDTVLITTKDLQHIQNRKKDYVAISRNATILLQHREVIKIPYGTILLAIDGQQVVLNTASQVLARKGRTEIKAKMGGTIHINKDFVNEQNKVTIKNGCEIDITFEEQMNIPLGAILHPIEGGNPIIFDGLVLEKSKIKKKSSAIASWDPHNIPIFSESDGIVHYDDIIPDVTMREDDNGKVIIEHKGEKQPAIVLKDDNGKNIAIYSVPEKARIEVEDNEKVTAGTLLAKTPREVTGTQDITGGLPRVTEILEARRPKNSTVISEITGMVELGEKRRGKRTIIVKNSEGEKEISREHLVPHGKLLKVRRGDQVKAGDSLVDGPKVPHDILRCCGVAMLQQYLLEEIQKVYWAQNVTIDDKHIEIIIRQMMRKVRVEKSGDTDFLPGAIVDKFKFHEINRQMRESGKKMATYKPLLLGITKASLQSESFISAASFQETTKVLTEAALAGKQDELLGLKENVILGHMVPAGTGFKAHYQTHIEVAESEKENIAKEPKANENLTETLE